MRAHASGYVMTAEPADEGLVAELKWVHGMIRQDLRTVRRLAAEVTAGLPGAQAAAEVRSLQVAGPLWQLKVNCLRYCRFVHMHHHGESAFLFPRLRRSNPALGPVVDKLEADHARVSDLLDEVSAAATDFAERESEAGRARLSGALDDLSRDLLEHLDYEESSISETLRTWTGWAEW